MNETRLSEVTDIRDLVQRLLPPGVIIEVAKIGGEFEVTPQERNTIAGAIEARQQEFLTGRTCARRALRRLNASTETITVGSSREPLWPPGITGSIAHDGEYCVVVMQCTTELSSIGIDITRRAAFPQSLIALVCTDCEVRSLTAMAQRFTAADPFRIAFALKESFFKCAFPLLSKMIDCRSVSVAFEPDTGRSRFACRDERLRSITSRTEGSFGLTDGYVLAGAWLT